MSKYNRASISSLQKKPPTMPLNGFQHSTHPFLSVSPWEMLERKFLASLNRNKNEKEPTSLELVYTKKHQFRSQVLQGLDLIFSKKSKLINSLRWPSAWSFRHQRRVWSASCSLRSDSVSHIWRQGNGNMFKGPSLFFTGDLAPCNSFKH